MLNAELLKVDSAGGLVVAVAGIGTHINFNGGTPAGDDNTLIISTSTPDQFVAGVGYTNKGALCVDSSGAIAESAGGMPVTAAGKAAVSYGETPSTYLAGVPFDAAGRLCLATIPG